MSRRKKGVASDSSFVLPRPLATPSDPKKGGKMFSYLKKLSKKGKTIISAIVAVTILLIAFLNTISGAMVSVAEAIIGVRDSVALAISAFTKEKDVKKIATKDEESQRDLEKHMQNLKEDRKKCKSMLYGIKEDLTKQPPGSALYLELENRKKALEKQLQRIDLTLAEAEQEASQPEVSTKLPQKSGAEEILLENIVIKAGPIIIPMQPDQLQIDSSRNFVPGDLASAPNLKSPFRRRPWSRLEDIIPVKRDGPSLSDTIKNKYVPKLQSIYREELRKNPDLKGEIHLCINVNAHGKVQARPVIIHSTLHQQLEQRLLNSITRWNEFGEISEEQPSTVFCITFQFGE
ncbi:MAG: hypothetical protein ACREOO_04165 [bacterium]